MFNTAKQAMKDSWEETNKPKQDWNTDESGVAFDKAGQVKKIRQYIRPYESLRAVFDMKGGGTGFIAITDRRLIFFDKAFLNKKKAMVTVPFARVSRIASEDDGGYVDVWASSKLTVCAGSDVYEFEFWGKEKAHRAYELITDGLIG